MVDLQSVRAALGALAAVESGRGVSWLSSGGTQDLALHFASLGRIGTDEVGLDAPLDHIRVSGQRAAVWVCTLGGLASGAFDDLAAIQAALGLPHTLDTLRASGITTTGDDVLTADPDTDRAALTVPLRLSFETLVDTGEIRNLEIHQTFASDGSAALVQTTNVTL